MNDFRPLFLLDPDVTFLNHGSFGAVPRIVLAEQQRWQRQLAAQPVAFLGTDLPAHLQWARTALGEYVGVSAENLAFIPNATTGVNIVARSLPLGPGDEIVLTDHEYGACVNTWHFISRRTGARLVPHPIALPITDPHALVDALWARVTPRTRLIFISHITSATAQLLPVAELCARARAAGIWTLVDGAHAPGQLALDLAQIDADFYTGNAHKWLLAPVSAAFLYVRPALQPLIEPLVVSWGWGDNVQSTTGSRFLDILQWSGTADPSAYLSVPAAIAFQAQHDWPAVRRRCSALRDDALAQIAALTGLPPLYAVPDALPPQMGVAALPPIADLPAFKRALLDRFRVEIPCIQWGTQQLIRISVQAYNDVDDVDRLLSALRALLP